MRSERWQKTTGCYGWNTETWQGSCSQILSILALTLHGGNDELLRMLARLTLRQEDAISQLQLDKSFMFFIQCGREHHANFVDPGQGMEPAQGEGRGQNAVEDAHVPAVLPAACTEGSAIETRCKRRRLSSEPEVQRHLDRGQQVGISLMGQSGHDAQAQSDAATDLGRDSLLVVGTNCTPWPATRSDPQVLGLTAGQAGYTTSRRHDRNTMALGPQPEVPRGLRTIPASSEVSWQWHHSADSSSGQGSQPPTITTRQCHLPTIEEIVIGILETKLGGSGSTCYINSVLLAQTWSSVMSLTFNTAIWGAWEKQFSSMFVEHAGVVVDPCAEQFLGHLLVDWFKDHPSRDQHDAGEFAGWFRQRLLEKTLPQYMQEGWSSRLLSSTEDHADVFAPVPMACPVEGFITLQQMITNWHHQEPFAHAFTCDSPWICLQVSRFPSLGQKSRCSVLWDG